MPRLTVAQSGTRQRINSLMLAGLGPVQLATGVAEALHGAVPCDGYRFFGIDPGTDLVNRLLAASDNDGDARTEWLREVYLAAEPLDYLELPNLLRSNLRAVAFQDRQDACWGYPREMLASVSDNDHYHLFHDFRSPVGGTVLISLRTEDRSVGAVQWYRRDPKSAFRAGDVAFINQMVPIISKGLAASYARESAHSPETPEASGVLIVDALGRLQFGTPAGERWASLLSEIERSRGHLPTSVQAAIASLRRRDDVPAGTVIVPFAGQSVRVEASPAGTDGSVAIVISAVSAPPVPSAPLGWPLTKQEREIVDLLIVGMGNREIADRLFVSENTVEWHLRHVYEKLGIQSRSQLLARLFREIHLPGVMHRDAPVA